MFATPISCSSCVQAQGCVWFACARKTSGCSHVRDSAGKVVLQATPHSEANRTVSSTGDEGSANIIHLRPLHKPWHRTADPNTRSKPWKTAPGPRKRSPCRTLGGVLAALGPDTFRPKLSLQIYIYIHRDIYTYIYIYICIYFGAFKAPGLSSFQNTFSAKKSGRTHVEHSLDAVL